MLLSYNTINGTEVYEIDPVVRIKTFVNMCDGYEYIRRALDPVIHMVHWFKLDLMYCGLFIEEELLDNKL